jgi:CheY-like chemotaxis protein
MGERRCYRILVVDDNVDAAESMAMLLRLWGHEVRVGYTASSALAEAPAFQPQIILLDIGLPRISGYDVAREIRQQAAFRHTILIAITGYGQEEDQRRSQEAGFDYHLTKPVDPNKLETLLSAIAPPS